ncbi:nucleotide-binding alpha-beta plait domain-containing protein [Tanacetum coccineum]
MDPNQSDEERNNLSEVDDETDVYFMMQAYKYNEWLQQQEAQPRLTHNPIHHDRETAEERLMADYFDEYSAIRQLAYGNTPDAFDEYLKMSERTAHNCLFHFNKCIIDLYMLKYLRKPTLEDVEKLYAKHENVHGFSGMLGSIDFMHCEWKNYPTSWQGQYAGANNDINVLDNSSLFDELLEDIALLAPFVVNGVGFKNGYYLAD